MNDGPPGIEDLRDDEGIVPYRHGARITVGADAFIRPNVPGISNAGERDDEGIVPYRHGARITVGADAFIRPNVPGISNASERDDEGIVPYE